MFTRLKTKFYRWRAKRTLVHRYEYLNEVNKVLEEYLTDKLLQGGSQEFMNKGRQDLSQKQAEVRENSAFVSFLKKIR